MLSLPALLEPAEGKDCKSREARFHCWVQYDLALVIEKPKSSTCMFELYPSDTSVLLSQDWHNKFLQTGRLKARKMYCLTVLETRSPKSRCWLDCFLPRALRPNLFCASLLAPGSSRHPLACRCIIQILPSLSSHGHLLIRT